MACTLRTKPSSSYALPNSGPVCIPLRASCRHVNCNPPHPPQPRTPALTCDRRVTAASRVRSAALTRLREEIAGARPQLGRPMSGWRRGVSLEPQLRRPLAILGALPCRGVRLSEICRWMWGAGSTRGCWVGLGVWRLALLGAVTLGVITRSSHGELCWCK